MKEVSGLYLIIIIAVLTFVIGAFIPEDHNLPFIEYLASFFMSLFIVLVGWMVINKINGIDGELDKYSDGGGSGGGGDGGGC